MKAPKVPKPLADFEITPAMRAYLSAFDAYLLARKSRDAEAEHFAETARRHLLAHMERDAVIRNVTSVRAKPDTSSHGRRSV